MGAISSRFKVMMRVLSPYRKHGIKGAHIYAMKGQEETTRLAINRRPLYYA
jgi:hypothetical protein